jgi:hypothetical protein
MSKRGWWQDVGGFGVTILETFRIARQSARLSVWEANGTGDGAWLLVGATGEFPLLGVKSG